MDRAYPHQCPTCKKGFRVPSELKRHLNRKRPCAPVFTDRGAGPAGHHICKFCNRTFSQSSHVKRHQLTACPISPSGKNGSKGMELLYSHLQERDSTQQSLIANQEQRIRELEEKVKELKVGPAPGGQAEAAGINQAYVTINGDNARVLQVQVIHQSPRTNHFGEEKVEHIGREEMYKLFSLVAPRAPVACDREATLLRRLSEQLITRAAMLIYSNPDHPENITCYLPKKTDNAAMVHGRYGWSLEPVSVVFPPMLRRSVDLLFSQQPIPGLEGCPEKDPQVEAFEQLLKHIGDNEQQLSLEADSAMRPVLIRNTDLLKRVCRAVEGEPCPARPAEREEPPPKLSALVCAREGAGAPP